MDPYKNVIPDDHGDEIKELVRQRDGSDSEERIRKRARADTRALLPPNLDQQDQDQDHDKPPKPEEDLAKYDEERLRKGLSYVAVSAKRKITPRTSEFLRMHKDAYKAALDDEPPVQASQAVVQALDKVYDSTSYFFEPREPKDHEKLMAYVELRRLELMGNYGDYLDQELQDIRASQAIADEVVGANMEDLRKHVDVDCSILGLDPDHMLWVIKQWADGNQVFNQTHKHISDCHWSSLADQTHRDLNELLNIAPDRETAMKYEEVLLSIQAEYFDVYTEDNPQHWLPNEIATKLTLEMLGGRRRRKNTCSENKGLRSRSAFMDTVPSVHSRMF